MYTSKGIVEALPLQFFLERYQDAYRTEIQDFIKTPSNRIKIRVDGSDSLQSLKIGLAAIKSLKENEPVKISEIIKSKKVTSQYKK